jgi:hypothetical protein
MEKFLLKEEFETFNAALGVSDERDIELDRQILAALELNKREESFSAFDIFNMLVGLAKTESEAIYMAFQAGQAIASLEARNPLEGILEEMLGGELEKMLKGEEDGGDEQGEAEKN